MIIKNMKRAIHKIQIKRRIHKLEKKQKARLAKNNKALKQYYEKYWKNTADLIPHFKHEGRYYFYLLHSIEEHDLLELLDFARKAEQDYALNAMQKWIGQSTLDSVTTKIVQDMMERYRPRKANARNILDYNGFIEQLQNDPKFEQMVENIVLERVSKKSTASE